MESALMTLLDEELKCPVCLGIVYDPVILPCRHHFCKICINTAWTMDRPLGRCPVCKRCYMRRPNMMQTLNLTNLANQYQNLKPNKFKHCGHCRGQPGNSVAKVCLTCDEPCCRVHIEEHLNKPSSFPGHLMVNIEEVDNWTCSDHELYKLLYCREEQLTLCRTCSRATCSSHTVCSVNEKSTEMKERLYVLERRLNDFDTAMAEELKEMRRDRNNMMQTLLDLREHVTNHYERMKNNTLVLLDDFKAAYKLQHEQHSHDIRIRRDTLRNLHHSTTMCLRQVDILKFLKKGEFHKELINRAKLELGREIRSFRKNPPNLTEILSTMSEHERRKHKFLEEMFQVNESGTGFSTGKASPRRKRTWDEVEPKCSTSSDPVIFRHKRLRVSCGSHGGSSQDPHTTPAPTHSSHDTDESPSSPPHGFTASISELQIRTQPFMVNNPRRSSSQDSPPPGTSPPRMTDHRHGCASHDPHATSTPTTSSHEAEYPSSLIDVQIGTPDEPFMENDLISSPYLDPPPPVTSDPMMTDQSDSATSQDPQVIFPPSLSHFEIHESPSSSPSPTGSPAEDQMWTSNDNYL